MSVAISTVSSAFELEEDGLETPLHELIVEYLDLLHDLLYN